MIKCCVCGKSPDKTKSRITWVVEINNAICEQCEAIAAAEFLSKYNNVSWVRETSKYIYDGTIGMDIGEATKWLEQENLLWEIADV